MQSAVASFNASSLSDLPVEVIANIIAHLIPSNQPLVLPQSHAATKALLSLTQTCRATHTEAIRILYTHCLHIDTVDRLHQLSTSLSYMAGRSPTHFADTPLTGLDSDDHIMPKMRMEDFEGITSHQSTPRLSSLPIIAPHRYITSIQFEIAYSQLPLLLPLIPFAHSIYNLFSLCRTTLRHLFLDVPLDYLYRDRSQSFYSNNAESIMDMRLGLRSVFLGLPAVETLWTGSSSLTLSFSTANPSMRWENESIYLRWSRLKCLQIEPRWYRGTEVFWSRISQMASLETMVLVQRRSMPLDEVGQIKREWEKVQTSRRLNICLVGSRIHDEGEGGDNSLDNGLIVVKQLSELAESFISLDWCRDWVKEQLLARHFPEDW